MTPSGIEPATSRFAAKHLSHCVTAVPPFFFRPRRSLGWVEVYLYFFLGPSALERSASFPGLLYPGKDPVPIVQEAGWAPGPVWTGGKSRPHGDSFPDRPARSQSLYRLSCLCIFVCIFLFIIYVYIMYVGTYAYMYYVCMCMYVCMCERMCVFIIYVYIMYVCMCI